MKNDLGRYREAERIAAGLTPAQRRLVLASDPDDITDLQGCGVDIKGATYRTAAALKKAGLGSFTHGSSLWDMYWNLPLGLAVRKVLERSNDTD